jgi:hypothetical protein
VGLVCLKDLSQWSGDPACLWMARLAGFRGKVLAEIVQAYAGVRAWPGFLGARSKQEILSL